GIGTDLPRDVNLNGRVDGSNFGIPPNNGGIIGIGSFLEMYQGIVIHKIIQFWRTYRKTGNDLTGFHLLFLISDDARFYERQDAVIRHFSMDSKSLMTGKSCQHHISNSA